MSDFRLNRLFSNPLSTFLIRLPITPNQVTSLSLACGLAAGFFFSLGTFMNALAGAGLYQTAVILDNCDGDIARAKNLKSSFGAYFDITADFITDFSLFAGIALGLHKFQPDGTVVLFSALALSGAVMHFLLVLLEKNKGFGPAQFGTPHPEHEHRKNPFLTVFDAFREGDSSWFVVIFCLLGKSSWILWLGGIYMQILWIAAVLLNFKWLIKRKS